MGSAPICDAFKGAELVLLADVEDVTVGPNSNSFQVEVRVRVVEQFKGTLRSDQTIVFERPSVESFQFVKGQRVLVYANQSQGRLSSACTRTREAMATDGEVAALRALASGQPGGLVNGGLWSVEGGQARNRHGGVRVSLRGAGLKMQVTTEPNGTFQFGWAPPGAYILSVEGVDGYQSETRTVVIDRRSGCVAVPSILLRRRGQTPAA